MFTVPSAPAPIPAPGLRPPPGHGAALANLWAWASHRPWLALIAITVLLCWAVATSLVLRWRHARLTRDAQQVTITTPPEVDEAGAAQFWRTVYGTLHRTAAQRLLHGTPHLAYEYRWAGRALTVVIWVPGTVAVRAVAAAARAAWPASTVTIDNATAPIPIDGPTAEVGGALLPVKAEAYPLRAEHDTDPLRQVVGAGTGLRHHEHACIQILARPAAPRRLARMRRATGQLRDPSAHGALDPAAPLRWLLDLVTPGPSPSRTSPGSGATKPDPARERDIRSVIDKATDGPHWETAIRYAVTTSSDRGQDSHDLQVRLSGIAGGLAAAYAVYTGPNRLRRVRMPHATATLSRRALRRGFVLSTPELTSLAGLPTDVAVPGLARARAKAVPAPVQVLTGGRNTIPLGRAQVGNHGIALAVADARQHAHVVGSTGSGKSTLLLNVILAHIKAGRGVVVIDPKGDLVTDILDRLPFDAAAKVVLLDPAQDPPPAFNPLQGDDDDLVVDNIVSIFGKIFARHWGPRIDDILRSALLTLMQRANPMLTMVPPLLNDKQLRAELTADLHDPAGLGGFWTWYDNLPEGIRAQAVGPVLARLRAMLTRRFVRRVVGQPTSSFDMAQILDGAILLCRLPKGVLGDDTTRLLGSFVVASAWQAATARAGRPEDQRRDAVLVIDECQNFLNLPRSIDEICAEARGYHLSLILAHQDLTQLPRETAAAISANCRNKIVFNCSPEDARVLARHTWPELDEHDLSHLDRFTAATRLVVDGAETAAFTMLTNPPPEPEGKADLIRAEVARLTAERLPNTQPANAQRAGLPADIPAPGQRHSTRVNRRRPERPPPDGPDNDQHRSAHHG
ncbi:MAG TPA: type IV secretion system DNA-binding domain-containing protein [Micromonosporaceae bacterium]|nr:type IV secretion system DNA-binding domain-containing protein [Micromonosporaceae bacterium]